MNNITMTIWNCDKTFTLQWRYNERDGVSNHWCFDCLLNRLIKDQRKHQRSASLALVRGIHWWPVNSPHKGPVTRKMFPFDYAIMDTKLWHEVGFEYAFIMRMISWHIGQWRGALMFSLIRPWQNGWLNNQDDGDLRQAIGLIMTLL